MSVPPNFSIVTLGVSDLRRSTEFYQALGWEQRGADEHDICWFKTSGSWVGLFGSDALAADIGLVDEGESAATPPTFRGITLAVNVNTEAEVDAALAHAVAVGGAILKPATKMSWGGYSGYFTDPDGHVWEVAHARGFHVDEHGRIDIP